MASDAKKQPVSNVRLANERKKRQWTQSDLASSLYRLCDEEELAEHGTIDGNMVSKWERGLHTPGFFWQRKLRELFGLDAAALGFIDQVKTDGPDGPQEASAVQFARNADLDERQTLHILLPSGSSPIVTVHVYQPARRSPSNSLREDGMLDTRMVDALRQAHLREREPTVNRRDFTRRAIGVTTAAFVSPDDLLHTELLDRFSRALQKPSTIDERLLDYLEARTAHYWQDRHGAVLASSDLLSFVIEHLQKIIKLLEESLLPSMRTRLCCLASGVAQLAGHLLFDLGKFAPARDFHQLALAAAQAGEHQALEAVAWGRMSFPWTYSQHAPEALGCIQEARRLAAHSANNTVRAYLAAVEAEIQATLSHREACFRRLYHPDDAQTQLFLKKAEAALTDALRLLEPARIQRRPTLLIDLASTSAQQGDVDGAYEHAMQALSLVAQTKSQAVAKRLLSLRQELEPWKDTHSVKNLDQQMAQLITSRGV